MHALLLLAMLAFAGNGGDDAEAPLRPYRIKHDGLSFVVLGQLRHGTGGKIVDWDRTLYANATAYKAAREARDAEESPAHPDGPRPPLRDPGTAANPSRGRPIPNFGLAPDWARRGDGGYQTGSGPEAARFVEEARAASTAMGGEGAASGAKLHLTVIGPEVSRAAVLQDLATHPELATLRDRLLIQDYQPGEWPVDPALGFPADGSPAIVIQTAKSPSDPKGGRVVYRSRDYAGGPTALAQAIRKADPHYRPDRDPGPDAPDGGGICPLGFDHSHWRPLAAVGVVAFLVLMLPMRRSPP